MSRAFLLMLLLCIFFTCYSCSINITQNDKNDLREFQEENEIMLTLSKENLYTFRDPIYHFSMSFPGKFSFFLYGYDRSYDSGYESPDRTVYIFLDSHHMFDFVNYIEVTGQFGRAARSRESFEKKIDIINDAGQEATMYYMNDEEDVVFEYTIMNGNQFVRGCFELDFYENNEETILAICKSVQDNW